MILTCPSCNAQFYIFEDVLGEKGRKVKCSTCKSIWFQTPDGELGTLEAKPEDGGGELQETNESTEKIIEDIENAINALKDESADDRAARPVDISDKKPLSTYKKYIFKFSSKLRSPRNPFGDECGMDQKTGYGVAAGVFFLILFYLLISSHAVMQKHPSMQAFYAIFGIHMDIAGDGLIFDNVKVDDLGESVRVSGKIINLQAAEQAVPLIEASLQDLEGNIFQIWYITPPKNIIEAEGSYVFETTYYKIGYHQEIGSAKADVTARLRFILPVVNKTDVKDGADNHAPLAHDLNHQSDGAKVLKSHQPASSELHQESSH